MPAYRPPPRRSRRKPTVTGPKPPGRTGPGLWTRPTRRSTGAGAIKHFAWRTTLPEVGQGGIAVWGDRVFVTTLKPEDGQRPNGKEVIGYCLDARNGKILWTVALPGSTVSVPAYFFSDATSPTPITDGNHVWFFNACGSIGCYDYDGGRVWLREWEPTTNKRPFNKQFEPMLFGDAILNMEPHNAGDPKREADPWNYLRGLDRKTGKPLWVADDAMTHYNTPVFGVTANESTAVLQGRGAYHGVPETPIGLSLTSLAAGREGKTIWRYEGKGKATYTQHWNEKYACWIALDRRNTWSSTPPTASRCARNRDRKGGLAPLRRRRGKYVLLADVNLAKLTPPMSVSPPSSATSFSATTTVSSATPRRRRSSGRPTASGGYIWRREKSSISKCRFRWSARRASRISSSTASRKLPRRSTRTASTPRKIHVRAATAGGGATSAARRRSAVRFFSRRCSASPTSSTAVPRCWTKRPCGRQRPRRPRQDVEPQLDQLCRGAVVPSQHQGDRLRRQVRADERLKPCLLWARNLMEAVRPAASAATWRLGPP